MVVFGSARRLYCWIGAGVLTAAIVCTIVLCVTLLPRQQPPAVRNLLTLSATERRKYLASFDLVLSDLDGTVWALSGDRIPGAAAGVAALQALPRRVVFVTNNALRSDAAYEERFRLEGFNATMADVVHPAISIVDYLQQSTIGDGLIYAMASPNVRQYLRAGGLRLVPDETRAQLADNFAALAAYVRDGLPVRAVVLDWDSNLELKQLMRAEAYLADAGCEFVVGVTDDRLPLASPMLGPGMVQQLLERAAERPATVLGKPGVAMRDVVMRKFGVQDARRILFVGDTLKQDIGFGRKAGFQTLAVLTGAASLESIAATTDADEVPDFYLPSFADFVELCADA